MGETYNLIRRVAQPYGAAGATLGARYLAALQADGNAVECFAKAVSAWPDKPAAADASVVVGQPVAWQAWSGDTPAAPLDRQMLEAAVDTWRAIDASRQAAPVPTKTEFETSEAFKVRQEAGAARAAAPTCRSRCCGRPRWAPPPSRLSATPAAAYGLPATNCQGKQSAAPTN